MVVNGEKAFDLASILRPGLPTNDGQLSWTHFVSTAWIALVMMVVREVGNQTVQRFLRWKLSKLGKARNAEAVWENLYIVVWSIATEGLAIYITLHHSINGGCTPWSTGPCLTGWPHHNVHILQKWYQLLVFHFYLHELLGACIGQTRVKTDMLVHHFATMGLIFTSYELNLNRYAIMWQALFDFSNPLLHSAKGLHSAGLPQLESIKWGFFSTFALTFFVCRVAAAPFSILYPALTRSLNVLPKEWAFFLMGLMFIVCGIQWVWFYRIVMMAMGKGAKEEEGDQAEAAKPKQQ